MLKAHFGNNEPNIYEGYTNPTNNQWTPREIHHSVKTYIQAVKNDIVAHEPNPQHNRKQNLTHGEKQALATLKERDDLIISKADKGGAVVLQNVTDYIQEAERQLRDTEFYEKVDRDLTEAHTELINNTIERFQRENLIP